MSRFARKVDENQSPVVEALRAMGVKVEPRLARVGNGVGDLLCGLHGRLFILEVKMPGEKLTEAEQEWHEEWAAFPVYVVESPEQAVAVAKQVERRSRPTPTQE